MYIAVTEIVDNISNKNKNKNARNERAYIDIQFYISRTADK